MNMTSSRPYMLRALYDWIVDNDGTPYILVDARIKGVEVPVEYVKDGQIVLNIAPMAVRALEITNEAITFDARFGGRSLIIYVPTEAVMAIYANENGQGMVFELEAPSLHEHDAALEELGDESSENDALPLQASQPLRKSGRPHLKIVK
ncbi:Stringent starvation protein B [invertebrate metagenome]|uniref:Stringent starvation protein B n=1 Tax=invertebrate metagenome TaxID=1711999 RepID=A0A2H9T7V2_9ZZZZ